MLKLHEVQSDISRYVFGHTNQIPNGINSQLISAKQSLAIYRNNTRLGLTEVLREVYPVLNKLVGNAFFNRLAAAYIKVYPPHSACLLEFGGQFAEVIEDFQDAQALSYLPDTARLEWLYHEAYHEADDSHLDMSALARLSADDYLRLAFNTQSAMRFIHSRYPIQQIWAANQSDLQQQTLIDLAEGGCCLLLYRADFEVVIISSSLADYQCLMALSSGKTLLQAVELTSAAHAGFDIQSRLQYWLQLGLLTGFYLLEEQ